MKFCCKMDCNTMYSFVPNYFDFNFSATKKSNVSFWRYFASMTIKKHKIETLISLKKKEKKKNFNLKHALMD